MNMPIKKDERWLLAELYREHLKKPKSISLTFDLFKRYPNKTAREIIEGQNKYNRKRLWYVMNKFWKKDIVEYGTSLGTAWMTDKGIELVKEMLVDECVK